MPPAKKDAPARQRSKGAKASRSDEVESVIASLKKLATQRTRDGMARFAIPSDKAFGVAVGDIRKLAKSMGRNHELAAALWDTGWYEARMLACFLDSPVDVTPAQMDFWAKDFDSWAICDTTCFHLFDRTPHAWRKIEQWARRRDEFVKRAAFALLASIALHDKKAPDEPFFKCLPLAENAATDERNFVKKGVVWALRGIGVRNRALHAAALTVAQRLADSSDVTARWVGKTTLRELRSPAAIRRLVARG